MNISMEKAKAMADLSGSLAVIFKLSDSVINVSYFTDGVPALYGYTSEDFEALKFHNAFQYVSEYDAEYLRKGLSKSVENNTNYSFSIQVRHKNGSHVFFSGTCICLGTDEYGSFVFVCYLKDDSGKTSKNNDYKVLIENESRYKKMIEFGNIYTWDYDIAGNSVIKGNILNDGFENFYNNFPHCMIEQGIIESKDSDVFFNAIEKVKNGEKEVTYECWHHLPESQKPKYLSVKYVVDFDKNNVPVIAHGMAIDLTESKNAEINYEHRTNAVLRMNPDSMATFQINITANTCNSCSSAYTYFAETCKSSTYDDIVTNFLPLIPDKNEKIHFVNSFSRGSIISSFNQGVLQIKLEHHILTKSNHEEWVRSTVDIVKNPISGDVEGVLHITNIHHSKTVDSLINGTVQREFDYIVLAYVKTNSFVMIDRFNHEINDENPEFIGYFRDHFSKTIQSPDDLERVLSEFNMDSLVEKINTYGEYTLQYNTNSDIEKNRHKILRFSFLNNRKDIISVSCRDTTRLYNDELMQKKKLSDAVFEAEKANRAKSDFLSLVSHDIRTPLNGIMGNTQLALKEVTSEKVTKYLKKAEMSSSFLLGLINDLLDMSKIEAGKIELKPEIYSYKEFLEYINSVFRPLCQKKNIHFSIHTNDMVPYISVDKLRFNQIMFNLLSNACKYTNEGGTVVLKVNTEKVSESLCITTIVVKDNGIGMTEEFQEHLFETFSQENRMNFDSNEGTGLGLSITHSLIELMGGEIFVDSEIDKGTTFTVQITLPFFEEIEEENSHQGTDKRHLKKAQNDYTGFTFLLCEDNVINQEIANEILTNLGAKVEIADDGDIGVKMFKESLDNHYNAIFMDIRMPNLDGLSASKAIRELEREDAQNVPIIAMTANAMSEDKMECIEAGMNAFIAKPIDLKELYKTMESVIE